MKILILVNQFFPRQGGLITHAWEVAKGLRSRSHEVKVVALADSGGEEEDIIYDGIPVHKIGLPVHRAHWLLDPITQLKVARCKIKKFILWSDAIVSFHHTLSLAAHLTKLNRPLLYFFPANAGSEIRNNFPRSNLKMLIAREVHAIQHQWIQSKAVKYANFVFVISENMRRVLSRAFKVGKGRVIVNYPGTAMPSVWQTDMKNKLKEDLGIEATEKVILFVGRLIPHKQVDLLLKAFSELSDLSAHLFIVGDGVEGKKLDELASKLHVSSRVHFVRQSQSLDHFFRMADVFVLPSKYEGFGLVLIEAMAYGVPCVAFRPHPPHIVGAADEIIDNTKTGLLVDEFSHDSLATAMRRVLSDLPLQANMAKESMSVCLRKFTWEKHINQIEAVIR